MGIPAEVVTEAMENFQSAVMNNELEYLSKEDALAHVKAKTPMEKILLPAFFQYLRQMHPESVQTLSNLTIHSDLTNPANRYPETREMRRKLILHVGPTNSGKTYAALRRFEQAKTALYCGPLRLLAHEIYERSNVAGIPCNLITGEEKRESDGVYKWAATVEMANMTRPFEVAVLDEIQMIGDPHRGWAWTNAVLGIQAQEVHLCGEPTVVPLIQKLAESTGDEVEIHKYERLTPLKVLNTSLDNDIKAIQKGDCIVTFSRADIFAVKRLIEKQTNLKAAVIYGSLPPETRAEQAKLFNDPNSKYDVLVASDAIGMGLNLNIKRIIFERTEKYDGQATKDLSVSQMKQIAGRAGRFKTHFPEGAVTTLDKRDMGLLHRSMKTETPRILAAGLHPTLEQVEAFGATLPNEPLAGLLARFEDVARLGGHYFLCNLAALHGIAELIESIPLNLRDRFTFVQSPCPVRDTFVAACMLKFARCHAEGRECLMTADVISLPKSVPEGMDELRELESAHRGLILYLWLGQRFPETFTDLETASHLKRECEALINYGLANIQWKKTSKKKKKRGPVVGGGAEVENDVVLDGVEKVPPEEGVRKEVGLKEGDVEDTGIFAGQKVVLEERY
ncbi:ATP-dependent RNA helicase supv3l1, mitochondrial [Rhizophlyctis rosea]|nr:ATP-dependent RNA helicase supv3l1, mitochondrial [Rhizophlyctis rosea]